MPHRSPPLDTLAEPQRDHAPTAKLPELPELPALDELRFRVGAEWARGGLGKVLEADDRFLGRRLAVKQLIDARDVDATARFVREALITARLQHPSIVPVYDAGVRGSGEPFYSMKLVHGRSLRDEIDDAHSFDDRLALLPHVQSVADAVAYAHEEGVIHRDLKPSNVLVGPFGETVVIDWGLAKHIDDDDRNDVPEDLYDIAPDDVTRAGAVLGTPAYMPPEQARGEAVDARADVYAIGAMLYHVLAGEPAYQREDSAATLRAVQAGAPVALAERERGAPVDLCAIVDKAMARDPNQRYPDARQLAADLKRFLTGQLVGARRYSAWALLRRWVVRHRAVLSVAVALLAVVAITATVSAQRVLRERDRATASNNRLLLQTAAAELTRDPTAAMAWLAGHQPNEHTLDRARDVAANAIAWGVARHVFTVPGSTATAVCLTRDGTRLAAVNRDGEVWLWNLATRQRRSLGALATRPIRCGFSPDGRYLVAVPRKGDTLMSRVPGPMEPLPAEATDVRAVQFMPGGATLLFGDKDGNVRTVDLASGASADIAAVAEALHWFAVSSDGARIAAVGRKGGVFVIDAATGATREVDRRKWAANGVALSADGRRLVHGGHDGVTLRDLETGDVWHPPGDTPIGGVVIASFLADGIMLSESMGQTLWLWHPEAGTMEKIADNTTHISPARSRDGTRVAWTGNDGGVHVLDQGSRRGAPLHGHRGHVRALTISEDGSVFATASEDGAVRVWQPPDALPSAARLTEGHFYLTDVPRHGSVVSATPEGAIARWRAQDDGTAARVDLPGLQDGRAVAIATSPGEDWVAIADGTRCRVRLYDPRTDDTRDLTCDGPGLSSVTFAGNESLLTGGSDGKVRHWNVATGEHTEVAQHRSEPEGIRASTDGTRAVSEGLDGLHFIDLTAGKAIPVPLTYGLVFGLQFSPDGRHVATGGSDGAIRLWDVATGEQRVLGRHRSAVMRLRWDHHSGAIFAGDEAGRVVRWTVRDGGERELIVLDAAVRAFELSASGRRLAIGDSTGLMRVLELETGATAVLRGHAASTSAARFATEDVLLTNDRDGWLYGWNLAADRFVPRNATAIATRGAAATTAVVGEDNVVATPVVTWP